MPRLVYDSALGGSCPSCRKTLAKCRCAEQIATNTRPKGDGVVRIRREVRNGKPMTVVLGLPCTADELRSLAAQLKQACGSGGTARDGAVEIQGDHRERIATFLRAAGHEIRFAGG